jgi:hypothetical protein
MQRVRRLKGQNPLFSGEDQMESTLQSTRLEVVNTMKRYLTVLFAASMLTTSALAYDCPNWRHGNGKGNGNGSSQQSGKKAGPRDGTGPIHPPGTGGGTGGGKGRGGR